jgi:hypothetical protein
LVACTCAEAGRWEVLTNGAVNAGCFGTEIIIGGSRNTGKRRTLAIGSHGAVLAWNAGNTGCARVAVDVRCTSCAGEERTVACAARSEVEAWSKTINARCSVVEVVISSAWGTGQRLARAKATLGDVLARRARDAGGERIAVVVSVSRSTDDTDAIVAGRGVDRLIVAWTARRRHGLASHTAVCNVSAILVLITCHTITCNAAAAVGIVDGRKRSIQAVCANVAWVINTSVNVCWRTKW